MCGLVGLVHLGRPVPVSLVGRLVTPQPGRPEPVVRLLLLLAVLFQVALGIWTLLWVVPLWLGLAHQGGALIVFAAAIWNLHCALSGERVDVLREVRA